MAEKKFNCKIKVTHGAFTPIGDNAAKTAPIAMTDELHHALSVAENLERYDDFSWLKIDPSRYRREGAEGTYGIAYDAAMHGENALGGKTPPIILENQKKAALRFLRDLRGFGLLADMVGSGKTFEAGVVLSELVSRGLIESLLIIVPNDSDENTSGRTSVVMEQWCDVLERRFGMGVGSIAVVETPDDVRRVGTRELATFGGKTYYCPTKPIIVTHENFDKWRRDDEFYNHMVFHMVMVDEIHRFYLQKEDYPNAMYVLSALMRNKRAANCPYCVLLSATPHSGNLESMFDLWYFIRFKGGTPNNFLEGVTHDVAYEDAKREYIDRFCRGASTISEFISESQSVKLASHINRDPAIKSSFESYLGRADIGADDYAALTKSEQYKLEQSFLHDEQPALHAEIQKSIAGDYHNGLMRKIMIRQRNHMRSGRKVYNYYIYPMTAQNVPADMPLDFDGRDIVVHPHALMTDAAITYTDFDGVKKTVSLADFSHSITRERGGENADRRFAELSAQILMTVADRTEDGFDPAVFKKENSKLFYEQLLSRQRNRADERDGFVLAGGYEPLEYVPDGRKNDAATLERFEDAKNADRIFKIKCDLTRKILAEHPNERVLIFFDYEMKFNDGNARQWERLYEALKDEFGVSEKGGRLISGYAEEGRSDDIAKFNAKENGVLIAWNKNFTESLNLQKCNIIINFQVTPDPLAMDQRIGRIYRLGQTQDISIYSFAQMNRLDGYALAYFNSIGLMSNCNGDATIVAGSNNEGMAAIQCPACNRVEMFTEGEVEAFRRRLKAGEVPEALKCRAGEECRMNEDHFTIMSPINTEEFICDKCKLEIRRGEDGYICPKSNDGGESGKLVNYHDRTYGCSKFCIVRNCNEFKRDRTTDTEFISLFGTEAHSLSDVCQVLNAVREGSVSEGELGFAKFKLLCATCPAGEHHICPDKCGFYFDNNHAATEACRACNGAPCRPFKYVFDDNWTAVCPACHEKKLHKKAAHTFVAYIRAAYNFNDGGKSFCMNFLKETQKVEAVKRILEQDEEETV